MGLGKLGWNWQELPQELNSWGRGTVAEGMEVRTLEVGYVLNWRARATWLELEKEEPT